MLLTMSEQPSKQSRGKADKIKGRLLEYLRKYSHAHAPIKSYKIQQMFSITDIVVRQAVGKLRDDGFLLHQANQDFL